MPYTVADVDSHIKNLSAKAKRQWVAIANSALKSCVANGGKESDCAGQAIRKASGVAGKMGEVESAERELYAALSEKGRVLSADSEKSIRAALASIQAVLAKVAIDDTTESDIDNFSDLAPLIEAAVGVLGVADSFDAIRGAVQGALRKRALMTSEGEGYDYPSCWIRDLFADSVVYSHEDTLYRCDYSISADDTVTLGDPTEVEVAYVPVVGATSESQQEMTGDLVPLVEKAIRKDGTVPIKLIQPGQGSSGLYPAAVLKRDGPRVFPKGTHMYADHLSPAEEAERPEGSIKNLMAVLDSDARWEDAGTDGPGLYANAKVMPHFADHLEALAPHIGVSIRAMGTFEEDGKSVKELVAAKSVDFVTRAGAGGKVLELFEAARGAASIVDAPPSGAVVAPLERSARMDDLQEAKGLSAEDAKALREAFAGQTREIDEQKHRIKQLEEMVLMRQVADFVSAELAAYTMPDMTRTRLAEALAERPKLKESGEIDVESFRSHIKEKVTGELRYLAEATGLGSGRIVGLGASSLQEADDSRAYESLEKSLGKMSGSPEAAKIAARGRRG